MMCYRDMTFCKFYKKCREGKTCGRALTKQVWEEAKKWFGSDEAHVCVFLDKPECFKSKGASK